MWQTEAANNSTHTLILILTHTLAHTDVAATLSLQVQRMWQRPRPVHAVRVFGALFQRRVRPPFAAYPTESRGMLTV